MKDYTLQSFEPQVGSTFQIMINGQPSLDLVLAEAEDTSIAGQVRDPSIRNQPISLIFNGPLTPIAPQCNYDLNHLSLGSLQLFLVPIGPDTKSRQVMQYQAIFN